MSEQGILFLPLPLLLFLLLCYNFWVLDTHQLALFVNKANQIVTAWELKGGVRLTVSGRKTSTVGTQAAIDMPVARARARLLF